MDVDYLFGKPRSMEAALSDLIETAQQSPMSSADRDRLDVMIGYLKEEIAVRAERRSEMSAPDC
jgi:hypothetical protein